MKTAHATTKTIMYEDLIPRRITYAITEKLLFDRWESIRIYYGVMISVDGDPKVIAEEITTDPEIIMTFYRLLWQYDVTPVSFFDVLDDFKKETKLQNLAIY